MEFKKIKDELPLVEVDTATAREHVPEIERYIRTIKERVRSTTSDFPFDPIPMMVLIQTVYSIIMWLNAVWPLSGVTRGLSPRELVTGRGVDYNKYCRADFGAYVQATTNKIVTNNNTPRTHDCIALGPPWNYQGSLKCFDPETGKCVLRRIIAQLPWPEIMIQWSNW